MKYPLRSCLTAALIVITVLSSAFAESARSWRIFNKNENTWVYYPKGLMVFSTLSRTVKPVAIDPVRSIDTLTDCIEYEGYLWVSCNAGVYQVDAASQSVERIPLPDEDSTAIGKIAQDPDYLWLGTNRKLLQFDKLGREWFSFDLPQDIGRIVGLWSNGDEVFFLGEQVLFRFSTATEKWNVYPLDGPLSSDAVFYPGMNAFKVIDNNVVLQYQPESFSWLKTDLGSTPFDIYDKESDVYCNYGNEIKQANSVSGMLQRLNIPNIDGIRRITLSGDSLMMVQDGRVCAFSITEETMNYTEFEKGKKIDDVVKILPLQNFLVLITTSQIVVYEKATKAWQYIPRSGLVQKVKAFTWNEEECALRLESGITTTLSGNIEMGMGIESDGYDYDTTTKYNTGTDAWETVVDSQPLMKFINPKVYGNVTMHSTDKNDRVADVSFNNSDLNLAPEKSIYYRGNKNDYLNSLRIGTTDNEQMATELLPKVDMEGGNIVLETKQRLKKRDRKIARLAAGAGYITSRTVTKKLPYRADGIYYLLEDEEESSDGVIIIIPGSIKVTVDGALIDSSYYTLYSSTGKLEFNTSSPIDPVSSMTVEYSVEYEVKPDELEFKPSNHFGKLQYGIFTLSPTEWISAKVGYTGIDRDSLNNIITASTPIELRNDKTKLMVKATPEFSYNLTNGARAGGGTLQSRFGSKTGLVFNTRFMDDEFVSTDTLTTGLGALRYEYDGTFNHDIRQELPQSYYQHQRLSENGSESRYEFKSGVHFNNFPFLDFTASRTVFEKDEDENELNVFDSMFHEKDKLHFRLYETSSKTLENLTGFSKISYELQHSEYRSTTIADDAWNSGRVTSAQFTLIPIQKIMILGEALYRGSIDMDGAPSSDVIPRMTFQFIDLPKGVDVSGYYFINNKRFWEEEISTDTIMRSVRVVLRPGQWWAPLGWFSPRAQLTQNIQTLFDTAEPTPWQVLTGNDGYKTRNIIRELGVNIFPVDGIMLTNTNRWSEGSLRDGYKFTSNNRLQMVFNSRNILTANYNYSADKPAYTHNALVIFEKTWNSWLRTAPAAVIDAKKDTTGSDIAAGPKLIINLNFQDIGIIRMLNNIHDVKFTWNRHNGHTAGTPDFNYNFSLRMKLKPNLELANIEQLQFKEGKFDNFLSRLNLFVYF